MDPSITFLGPRPTHTDVENIRTAFSTLAARGVEGPDAQGLLQALVDTVAAERTAALVVAPAPARPEQSDPTEPTPEENTALHRLLNRAVNVYNGRRGPYSPGEDVGDLAGIRSINRAAAARRIRLSGETDARLGKLHIDKYKQPGRTQRMGHTVAVPLYIGERVRALSATVIDTPKGLRITAFNVLH